MVRYLPKEWRLILVDLPGHGESSFEEGAKYDCFGFADKIHEVSNYVSLLIPGVAIFLAWRMECVVTATTVC